MNEIKLINGELERHLWEFYYFEDIPKDSSLTGTLSAVAYGIFTNIPTVKKVFMAVPTISNREEFGTVYFKLLCNEYDPDILNQVEQVMYNYMSCGVLPKGSIEVDGTAFNKLVNTYCLEENEPTM